jgi:hypothetical protein
MQRERLQIKTFTVRIAIVPTVLEQKLTGAQIEYKTVCIQGYTLADAKKRAGIR